MKTSNRLTRRKFIGSCGLLLTAGSVLRETSAQEKRANVEWRNKQPTMKYRRLGRTNFMVSEIGIGGSYINMDTLRMVEWALERGVNYIDTSSGYQRGQSEPALGELMKRKRDGIFLTTKVALFLKERKAMLRTRFENLSEAEKERYRETARRNLLERGVELEGLGRAQARGLIDGEIDDMLEREGVPGVDRKDYVKMIIKTVEGSLSRLKTDHVDIIVIPGRACTAYQANLPECHEAFERLKTQGKARCLGITTHSNIRRTTLAAIENGGYDMVMPAYNVLNHGELDDVLKKAADKDVGVVVMKAAGPVAKQPPAELPEGKGSTHQRAYRWVLDNPNVACVITAVKNQAEVEENVAVPSVKLGLLDREELQRLASRMASCRMCGRCTASCPLHLAIPDMMRSWMYLKHYADVQLARQARLEFTDLCLGCGTCERVCPSRIPIRERIIRLAAHLA